jgi:hypothetical protein
MLPIVPMSKKNLASRLALAPVALSPKRRAATFHQFKFAGRPAEYPSKSTTKLLDVHAGNWLGGWSLPIPLVTILSEFDQDGY